MARRVTIPRPSVRLPAPMAMFVLNAWRPPRGPPCRVNAPNSPAWTINRHDPTAVWRPLPIPAASVCQLVPEASRPIG